MKLFSKAFGFSFCEYVLRRAAPHRACQRKPGEGCGARCEDRPTRYGQLELRSCLDALVTMREDLNDLAAQGAVLRPHHRRAQQPRQQLGQRTLQLFIVHPC
jgi:hypothetical protein